MSYEPLHHKYRPQTFSQLVGQDAITKTLTSAIESRRIVPAYLFTGPRGTGKTSSARILAKSLNCLSSDQPTASPCGHCQVCREIANGAALDVIEIDAASNTGVDNIRELIERSQFAPVQCRYKVYVIDECHMLSTAAFNALLKTLEEPPERVVFVLATTDPQRVLPTIISRCQRFDFRRIPLQEMVSHLKEIATKEDINIVEDAIALVGQISNGGLRDAESLLDQLSLLTDTVTVERVWDLVGAVPEQDLMAILDATKEEDQELLLQRCRNLLDRGREPLVVLQNLAGFYRDLLIAKTAPNRQDMVALTAPTWEALRQKAQDWTIKDILQGQKRLQDSEYQLKNTTQPRLWLEVTLLTLLTPKTVSEASSVQVQATKTQPSPPQTPIQSASVSSPPPTSESQPQPESQPKPESQPLTTSVSPSPVESQNKTATPEKLEQSQETSEVSSQTPNPMADDFSNSDRIGKQLWKRALSKLHPQITQDLLSKKSNFVSFNLDDGILKIALTSQHFLNMAQTSMTNIQDALEEACNEKIKLILTIDKEAENKQSAQKSPPEAREKSSQKKTTFHRQTQRNFNPSHAVTSPSPNKTPSPTASQSTTTEKPDSAKNIVAETEIPKSDSVTPVTPPQPDLEESETENDSSTKVEEVAQLLATAFGGEVIEFDEDEPVSDVPENETAEELDTEIISDTNEDKEIEF